jgi:hypothetical protein
MARCRPLSGWPSGAPETCDGNILVRHEARRRRREQQNPTG